MTRYHLAIAQLAFKEIWLPIIWMGKSLRLAIAQLALKEFWLSIIWRDKSPRRSAKGKRCPGGLDHLFLAIIITCLFSLLQTLWAVQQGTIDKMTELMLGRISQDTEAGPASLLPVLFNSRKASLDTGDIGVMEQAGMQVFANAPVATDNLSILSSLVTGMDTTRLEGRFVQTTDPVWRAARPEAGTPRLPFVIIVNTARFQNSSVDSEKATEDIENAYSRDIADQWRRQVDHPTGARTRITDLETAWLKISHLVDTDGSKVFKEGTRGGTVTRHTLLPVQVIARPIPGVRAPDFLVPVDLLILINNSRTLYPEELNRRAGWSWFDADAPVKRCDKVEAASPADIESLNQHVVDMEGLSYGIRKPGAIELLDPLPESFLLAKLKDVESASWRCNDVPSRDGAWLARLRKEKQPLMNDAYAYVDWSRRQELPQFLDAINGGSATMAIHNSSTDPAYQDYAIRLLVLTSILEKARLPVATTTIGALLVAALGCLAIIISARRARFALLMSHGVSGWSLWHMLTIQLAFTAAIGTVLSFVLARQGADWLNRAVMDTLLTMKVSQDLTESLGDIVVVEWWPALTGGLLALAFLVIAALALLWRLGPWHDDDLGSHLISG